MEKREKVGEIVSRFGVTEKQRQRILRRCRGTKYFSVRNIIEEETRPTRPTFTLVYHFAVSGKSVVPSATIILTDSRKGDREREIRETGTAEEGMGQVSAVCKAIRAATGLEFHLLDFAIRMENGEKGENAAGLVTIEIECAGKRFIGVHTAMDIVTASAVAILDALNRHEEFKPLGAHQ